MSFISSLHYEINLVITPNPVKKKKKKISLLGKGILSLKSQLKKQKKLSTINFYDVTTFTFVTKVLRTHVTEVFGYDKPLSTLPVNLK